jgi:uncharacterized protein YceK
VECAVLIPTNQKVMKRGIAFGILVVILLTGCSPVKPYYETKEGKKKQRYYNDIQYGRNAHPKMKF